MKKVILTMFAAIIGVEFSAFADAERAAKLTPVQKAQIAWAIKILSDSKTLVIQDNQCTELDQDILSVLESEGYLEQGRTQPTTICIGPTK